MRMPESLQSLELALRDVETVWKTHVFIGTPSSADLYAYPSNTKSALAGVALGLTEGQCSKLVKVCKREDIKLSFLGTGMSRRGLSPA